MLKKKLKAVKSVTIYSNQNTWENFRDIVKPLKEKIISAEIKVQKSRYFNDFEEKYNPYTNEKNWGSNLDVYNVKVYSNLTAQISYFACEGWNLFTEEIFKFELEFNLPETMLEIFKDVIEKDFYNECVKLREVEINLAEQKRIREIGEEILNNISDEQ